MPPLPTVYAYLDEGIILEGTRWEPRRVFCTTQPEHADSPGYLFSLKYRRGAAGTAAAISEVVCHCLLRALGVDTLEAALIRVGSRMALSYAQASGIGYAVCQGLHFGTKLIPDPMPGPPEEAVWGLLLDSAELIRIWAADCWLMNLDRAVYGNILMAADLQGRLRLLAADQSDCFLGSGALADGSCFLRSANFGPAPYVPLLELERSIFEHGPGPLEDMAQRIRGAVGSLQQAVNAVPEEWWVDVCASPQDVVRCLAQRANRIHVILEIDKWREMSDATRGGYQFRL